MGVRLYVNNYSTKLTAQLLVGGLTANVTPGDGAALAAAGGGGNWFIGTLRRMSGFKDVAREIVKITARATDALTIVRAQESTSALQFEIGDQLDIDFTADSFTDAILVSKAGILAALEIDSWTWNGGGDELTIVKGGKTLIIGPLS